MKKIEVNKLIPNPNNPRSINKVRFEKLKKSIKEFPKMLELRPIVVDENFIVLGGNMRLQAIKELGISEVPYIQEKDLTEEQKKQFVIKDNTSFGEWDWDMLANGWDNVELKEWGIEVWQPEEIDYEPSLNPETEYSDITKEEIEREAKKLAEQMLKESRNVEVICPECNNEFSIQI